MCTSLGSLADGDHGAETGDHDAEISDHDAPFCVITMPRIRRSRCAGARTQNDFAKFSEGVSLCPLKYPAHPDALSPRSS